MTLRRGVGWLVATAALVSATGLNAHPASTFGVRLNVSTSTVTAILNADAGPLLARLDALAGVPPGGGDTLERIRRHAAMMAAMSQVTIDNSRVGLVPGVVRFNTDGQVEIVLTAPFTADTRAITWQSRLIYGAYPLSVSHGSNEVETVFWLQGAETSAPVPARSSGTSGTTVTSYATLGFVHILPRGLDHILFVLGLFLLTPRLKPLLAQVTVFTLAHSASLGLGISGVVSIPASIVEPLIALSIAYVGIENLFQRTLSSRRLGLVAVFGLLHGLGFAGVLSEISLPTTQWLPALFGFNVGIELGQLTVLLVAGLTMFAWTRWVADSDRWIRQPASAAIALMGVFWVIARV